MTPFTSKPSLFFSYARDFFQSTLTFLLGPTADPNKLAPPMSQYEFAQEWPSWFSISSSGSSIIKRVFLDTLPGYAMNRYDCSMLHRVDSIRLRRLSHFKCRTSWNHEFVRADLVDGNNTPLIMVWERDLPRTTKKGTAVRNLQAKSGLPCQPIDRVSYITETDFANFIDIKKAYVLRYFVSIRALDNLC